MPVVPFDNLPDDARVWVFSSAKPLGAQASDKLVRRVDEFLAQWKAHGDPLDAARNWRDERFLTIAVDQRSANASGCSIDGLFRVFKELEPEIGTSLLDRNLVFFSDNDGIHAVSRAEFGSLARDGRVTGDTTVFDPSVTTMSEWKSRFKSRANESWHAGLFPDGQAAPAK